MLYYRLRFPTLIVKLLTLTIQPHLVPKIRTGVCTLPSPYAVNEYIETILIYFLVCTSKLFAEIPFIKTWNMTFAVFILHHV